MKLAVGQSPFWPSLHRDSPGRRKNQLDKAAGDALPDLQLLSAESSGPGTASRGAMWRKKLSRQDSDTTETAFELLSPIDGRQDAEAAGLSSSLMIVPTVICNKSPDTSIAILALSSSVLLEVSYLQKLLCGGSRLSSGVANRRCCLPTAWRCK